MLGGGRARFSRDAALPQNAQASTRLFGAWGIHLCGGEEIRQRVRVRAHADPTHPTRLHRRSSAAGEGVVDDVTSFREPSDEYVGHFWREHGKVGAQGMQGMPPATGRTAPTLRQALHIRRSLASGRAAVHARSGPVNRFRPWPAARCQLSAQGTGQSGPDLRTHNS